jgi:hypothetical protein
MDFNSFYLKTAEKEYKIEFDDTGKIGLNQKQAIRKSYCQFDEHF